MRTKCRIPAVSPSLFTLISLDYFLYFNADFLYSELVFGSDQALRKGF